MADPIKQDDKKLAENLRKEADKKVADAKKEAKEAADKAMADAKKIADETIAKAQAGIPEGYKPFLVKAIATGYYDGEVRTYGAKFMVANDESFGTWMEPVNESDAKRLAKRMEAEAKARKAPAGPDVDPTGVIKAAKAPLR